MADDLGDEWWLENNENDETNCQSQTRKIGEISVSKKRKRHELRNIEDLSEQETVTERSTTRPKESVKKKKKKKKKKEETVEKTLNGKKTFEIFWTMFNKAVEGKLTSLELEDLVVKDEMFLTDPSVHTGSITELSQYLKTVVPKWSKLVSKIDSKDVKGSPGLLIITSAATRATELLRASADFRQSGKAVKLFSKHIKLEEQEKYLKEHVVHLGVGTPNRIYKLIQSGFLKLLHLKFVVLDWTWRDAKQRRIMDIPEIQQDLVTLLTDFVLLRARKRKTMLGLF